MQDDDTANPGMLWVLDGEKLWKHQGRRRAQGLRRLPRRCTHQHEGRRGALSRLRQDTRRAPSISSSASISCRAQQQQATPLAYESRDLLALTALCRAAVARRRHRNRRRSATRAVRRQGPRSVPAAAGPAQSRLRQLPRRQLGQAPGRRGDHAGPPDRLSALPAGMAIARFAAAPPARLHVGHPRPALRLRRAGTGRAGTLSDVARPRHADRGAGGAAVTCKPQPFDSRRPTFISRGCDDRVSINFNAREF